ncbi:hypothetical protein [Cupriavidus metallidurans]|uniref:hypothetical protein n=1 Tax=Cupriavidus metallidurans TaxID=119219 RepID=UPI001CCB011E|nr:hypothetical protein [Cupriavidus metallidurans]UBM09538.1 hypothetical protein LAI70_09475 [Cupriavidus metallidurans]
MGKTKKPRKAYRPRAAGPQGAMRLQPWTLDMTFGPIESLLDQIEAGVALELSEDGEVMYHAAGRTNQYPLVESIRGVAETYDIARIRAAECPSTQAVHQFVDKVERGEALTSEDLLACRQSVLALRHFTARLSRAAFEDLARTALLKFSMDEVSGANSIAMDSESPQQATQAGVEIPE